MILSLQNISMETQAQSRLAVLCRELCRGARGASTARGPRSPRQWHRAYRPSVSTPVFCSVASLFTSLALDTRVNATQEGSP